MRITKKMVRELLEVLDEIVEEIRQEEKEKYPLCRMGAKERNSKEEAEKTPRIR